MIADNLYSQLLGADDLLDTSSLAHFLETCQFKFGGIAKAPGEHPGRQNMQLSASIIAFIYILDPYHTYLSLAALSTHPPGPEATTSESWKFKHLDPLVNANDSTAEWARSHIPGKGPSI